MQPVTNGEQTYCSERCACRDNAGKVQNVNDFFGFCHLCETLIEVYKDFHGEWQEVCDCTEKEIA